MPEFGTRSNNAAVMVNSAGVMIRYTFYFMGAAAFALISLSILKVFSFFSANRVVATQEPPRSGWSTTSLASFRCGRR